MKLKDIKSIEPKREHGSIEELKASIKQLGLLEPLGITKDKELVFGRRRYQALRELGFEEVEVVVVNPRNRYEQFLMALHENTKRKDLTEVEEAQWELTQKRLYEEQFPATKWGGDRKSKPQVADLKSYTEVKSKLEGVSRDTIERRLKIAIAVEEYPELVKEKSGQGVLREHKKQKEKEEILKVQSSPQGDNYKLYNGDFEDICQSLEPSSVDCIITDPPYGEGYYPLYEDVAKTALRLLKPNGSLLLVSGLMWLPALLEKVGKHLTYQWVLAFKMGTGTARVYPRKVCQAWKPVLWFVKGEYDGDWVTDFISSDKLEKNLSDHQQPTSLSDKLVADFSKPNDLILDPMMGTGTTGISALSLGRRFIGCEIDKDSFLIAQGRISAKVIS